MSKKHNPTIWADAPEQDSIQGSIGAPSMIKRDDYLPYMPNGVYDTGNIDLQRAQNQGTLGQAGKFVGNTLLNIGIGLGETVGYLGALATEWGTDRDYSNSMTEMMQDWKNPFGEIYRENPNETFDLGDPAWWTNNASGLISSVGQFAIAGAGIGSVLAKGAGALAKSGAITSRIAGLAAQTGTAAALAYTEGAMAANQVFKTTYEDQLAKGLEEGLDQETALAKATKIASQSAATTAQINTAINTVLNLGAVSPLFKEMKANGEFFRKGAGARQGAEELADWSKRLSAIDETSASVKALIGKKGIGTYLAEAAKEGGEEMVNQFAEATGLALGEEGETKGLLAQFTELESFLTRTINEEGALNFILGAVGGAGNTVALDFAPVHRDYVRNEDGTLQERKNEAGEVLKNSKGEVQYEKKYYTGRFMENNQRFARFNSAKEAVVNDIEKVSNLNLELNKAVETGDALKVQQIRKQLLSTHNLGAIVRGEGAQWKVEYEKYRDLDNTEDLGALAAQEAQELQNQADELLVQEGIEDPAQLSPEAQEVYTQLAEQIQTKSAESVQLQGQTEAMARGFATSMKDNDYKKRANEAIADLELFDGWHQEIKGKFRKYEEEDQELNLSNSMLIKKINRHYDNRALENMEGTISELETLTLNNGVTQSDVDSLLQYANNQYVYGQSMAHAYANDVDRLLRKDGIEDILSSYGIEYSPDTRDAAVKSLITKLSELARRRMEDVNEFQEYLKNSPEYTNWKTKNKSLELQDYINWLHSQATDNEALVRAYRTRDEIETRRDIATEQLNELENNPKKYVAAARKDLNQAKKDFEERLKFVDSQVQEKINERLVALDFRIDRDLLIAKRIEGEIEELTPKLDKAQKALDAYQATTVGSDISAVRAKRLARLTRARDKIQSKVLAKQAVLAKINGEVKQLITQKETPQEVLTDTEPAVDAESLEDRIDAAKVDFLALMARQTKKYVKNHMAPVLDKILDGQGVKRMDVSNEVYEQILTDAYDELAGRLMTEREKATLPVESEINAVIEHLPGGLRDEVRDILLTRAKDMTDTEHGWNVLKAYIDGKYISQAEATKLIALSEKLRGIYKKFRSMNEGFLGEDGTSTEQDGEAHALNAMTAEELAEYFFPLYPEQFATPEELSEGFSLLLARKGSVDRPLTADEEIAIRRLLVEEEPEGDQQKEPGEETEDGVIFDTIKNTTGVGVAALHLNYSTVVEGGVATNVNEGLNTEANLDVLLPEAVKDGSELILRVLPGYSGNAYTHDSTERTVQRARPIPLVNGRVPEDEYNSITIEIIDPKTGKRIGFVHDMNWLTERQGDYRNVAVAEDFDIDDPRRDGLPSMEDLVAELEELRKRTIEQFHDGKEVAISVARKGAGRMITTAEPMEASTLLPDESLEIKVVTSVTGVTPVVHIPMADGSFVESMLGTSVMPDADVDVMVEAIKIYSASWGAKVSPEVKADAARKAEQLKKLTGFDVTNSVSLKAFVNQYYTNTKDFKEGDLIIKEGAKSRFMFEIKPGKIDKQQEVERGNIKIGQSGRGGKAIYAIQEDGSFNPFFEAEFRKGIKTHKKSPMGSFVGGSKLATDSKESKSYIRHMGTLADVNGLGSTAPIQEINYDAEKGSFVPVGKPHKNYNEYAKSFTRTKIDGRNKVGDRYIYAVHPVIAMNVNSMRSSQELEEGSTTTAIEQEVPNIEVPTESPAVDEELEYDADDDSDELFNSKVLQQDSWEVLSSELSELRRNTDKTNDKTVGEAINDLKRLNLTSLPENYNPFREC